MTQELEQFFTWTKLTLVLLGTSVFGVVDPYGIGSWKIGTQLNIKFFPRAELDIMTDDLNAAA